MPKHNWRMLLFDFFPEDPHDSVLHCIICLHFPSDWCRRCLCPRHAPPSEAALFGSDWDVWNKKKRLSAIQYSWHVLSSQHPPSPPHQSLTVSNAIKILELQRWWLNAQLLIFSGSYSTPLSNYGRNQMNCNWINFPQSISVLSIHVSGSENTLAALHLSWPLFQIIIFFWKRDYTQRNMKNK